uniref:Uncharacterized protein n=1 Tax=Eutreptiella gymnastica TaxID=73025 RepID=A0A7S4D1Z7_9EUGL
MHPGAIFVVLMLPLLMKARDVAQCSKGDIFRSASYGSHVVSPGKPFCKSSPWSWQQKKCVCCAQEFHGSTQVQVVSLLCTCNLGCQVMVEGVPSGKDCGPWFRFGARLL